MSKSIGNIAIEIITAEAQIEALAILSHASHHRLCEFRNYYRLGQYNHCAGVIDAIKIDLVHYNLMDQEENDKFGDTEWKN